MSMRLCERCLQIEGGVGSMRRIRSVCGKTIRFTDNRDSRHRLGVYGIKRLRDGYSGQPEVYSERGTAYEPYERQK